MLASEIGLNPQLARQCGLLHDIGKAADHEMEGGHPKVGAELAKRYGITNKDILHAIVGHHDDSKRRFVDLDLPKNIQFDGDHGDQF